MLRRWRCKRIARCLRRRKRSLGSRLCRCVYKRGLRLGGGLRLGRWLHLGRWLRLGSSRCGCGHEPREFSKIMDHAERASDRLDRARNRWMGVRLRLKGRQCDARMLHRNLRVGHELGAVRLFDLHERPHRLRNRFSERLQLGRNTRIRLKCLEALRK